MRAVTVTSLLLVLLCGARLACAEDDHETARRAVEAGELLPLSRILTVANERYPGRVLEVDLDRENGRYLYEIEVLLQDGRVIELTYDGRTGELLETEIDDD
jgi:uncharacterized membrane protein YkoI